jgi:general secretion pathway protein H
MVLLAVVAGLAGSRMAANMDGPKLKATTAELAATLERAHSQAIVRNAPVSFRVDVDAPSFGIAGEGVHAVPDRVTLDLFTAIIDDMAGNVGEIRFFPDGSSTGGEVTLTGGDRHRYVQVDWLTGRVAVYEE